MKYTYLSPTDFEKNCPCHSFLTEYAQSLFPHSAQISFEKGNQDRGNENRYFAEYFVSYRLRHYLLKVSCTKLPDGTYSYQEISKIELS